MTTRTAAEALEKVLPCPCCGYRAAIEQVPPEIDDANAGGYYIECKRAGCGITTRLAFALKDDPIPNLIKSWNRRAALAQPQEGGSSETPRYDALEPRHKDWDDQGANWSRVKIDELLCDTLSALFDSETELARLLRATQNNGHSPVGDESHRRSAEGAKGCHEAPDAPCESPAQSAPAQEPVAWLYEHPDDLNIANHIAPRRGATLSAAAAGEFESMGWNITPLYAAPQPDEARELLDEAILYVRGDAESGYEDAVQLHERIRAYLEKHK